MPPPQWKIVPTKPVSPLFRVLCFFVAMNDGHRLRKFWGNCQRKESPPAALKGAEKRGGIRSAAGNRELIKWDVAIYAGRKRFPGCAVNAMHKA